MCKRFRILILNILTVLHFRVTFSAESHFHVLKTQRILEKQLRGVISPKMDYDEWTPLGRGDPLKNDPTFDYSPPMVGKVKYWINPLFRTPDPPIIPNKELTTESSQYSGTTTTVPTKLNTHLKQTSDIKRFYIDVKDPTDMTYVQLMNSKYNNKLVRPQHVSYQNHYLIPTKQPQPPPPLPMLVPPPPVEPNSYSSNKIENSTALELSWDVNRTRLPSVATPNNRVVFPTLSVFDSHLATKALSTTPKTENKLEFKTSSEKPFLKVLLGKETSDTYQFTNPTTLAPLTTSSITTRKRISQPVNKSSSYLIIQGHSKVKKYGSVKAERSEDVLIQDSNEINDFKFELPKDVRGKKQLNVQDFLPLNGIFGESPFNAEGFGFGEDLTSTIFPNFRPTTKLAYDSYDSSRKLENEDK